MFEDGGKLGWEDAEVGIDHSVGLELKHLNKLLQGVFDGHVVTRYYVSEGRLADYATRLGLSGFSVEETDSYVIDNFVVSGGHIPAGSERVQLSIDAMSADGETILWHLAP